MENKYLKYKLKYAQAKKIEERKDAERKQQEEQDKIKKINSAWETIMQTTTFNSDSSVLLLNDNVTDDEAIAKIKKELQDNEDTKRKYWFLGQQVQRAMTFLGIEPKDKTPPEVASSDDDDFI